ncbi:MAG TPA: MBL fold metallo-hydrolase, partial [Bacteroidia bacterium]|nr:MBL fold metallo-hydrolase [Bacteroidia bacterium]
MRITYYGHSCFLVEINGEKLLFDPFISQNPLASGIDTSKIQSDYIMVSHGHSDHTADLIALAQQTEATVISNWEICSWVQSKGYQKTHPMNIGGHW